MSKNQKNIIFNKKITIPLLQHQKITIPLLHRQKACLLKCKKKNCYTLTSNICDCCSKHTPPNGKCKYGEHCKL